MMHARRFVAQALLLATSAAALGLPLTAQAERQKGTLYLQNSIFRGLTIYWLFLGADGNFVIGPKHGVDPVNWDLERQDNAKNVGTYTRSGNAISVRYLNGKQENWAVEFLNGKLNTINGLFTSEQKPLSQDYRLDGSFSATLSALLAPGVTSRQTYTFTKDGGVTAKGLGYVNGGYASATATSTLQGRYAVSGNTLRLDFGNGRPVLAVIGVLPGEKPALIIDDALFK